MREEHIRAGAVGYQFDGSERRRERRSVHGHAVSSDDAARGNDVLVNHIIYQRFAGDRRSGAHLHLGALLATYLEVHFVVFNCATAAVVEPAPLGGLVGKGGKDALGRSLEPAFELESAVNDGWLGNGL